MRQPSLSILDIEKQDKTAVVENKRVEKKEFVIKRESNGMFTLNYTAGGEVPEQLKGFWTSGAKAERAAADYLSAKRAASAS